MDEPKPNSPADVGFTDPASRPPLHTGPGFCRSCKAPIYWVDINGKGHPVDREISEKGNVVVWRKTNGYLHGRVLKKAEPVPEGCVTRLSHFATCPQARQHRKEPRHG
jgi:hypothetical protein